MKVFSPPTRKFQHRGLEMKLNSNSSPSFLPALFFPTAKVDQMPWDEMEGEEGPLIPIFLPRPNEDESSRLFSLFPILLLIFFFSLQEIREKGGERGNWRVPPPPSTHALNLSPPLEFLLGDFEIERTEKKKKKGLSKKRRAHKGKRGWKIPNSSFLPSLRMRSRNSRNIRRGWEVSRASSLSYSPPFPLS